MATSVVFNGVTYSIPAYRDTGYAQGNGNLSQYLVALAAGPRLPARTSDPVAGVPLLYYRSDDSNALKYFDGTTARYVALI